MSTSSSRVFFFGLLLIGLPACEPPDGAAPPSEASLEARRHPTVTLAGAEQVLLGEPVEIRLDVQDNARLLHAEVWSSDQLGQGPCDASSGVCLDLAAPVQRASYVIRNGERRLSWIPSTAGAVHIQVSLRSAAGAVAVSDVLSVDVVPFISGCTRAASPDFNPAATVDDGSCACPARVNIVDYVDLVPYLDCESLGVINVFGYPNHTLSLPALRDVEELYIQSSVSHIELPALERYRLVTVRENPYLESFSATGITEGGHIILEDNPRLTTVDIASNGPAGTLQLSQNRALTALDVSGASLGALMVSQQDALVDLTLGAFDAEPYISIFDNASLARLDLRAVTSLQDGQLELRDLPAMANLPALPARMRWLMLSGLRRITTLDLRGIELENVSVRMMPRLRAARLGQVGRLESMGAEGNPALERLDLTGVAEVGVLAVLDNPLLAAIELPATLGYCHDLFFFDNPALCVTGEPALSNQPAGCVVRGDGNLCDP